MDLSTVEIPRRGAREAAAEYRRAAKSIADPERRREFEEISRAYRLAAKDDVAMIALTPTIRDGGSVTRELVYGKGTPHESRTKYLLPALAACRASAAFCYTLGVQASGSIEFMDSLHRRANYRSGRLMLETGFELPAGYRSGHDLVGDTWRDEAWAAMVPLVPPQHRPRADSTLESYLILWEVDDWRWSQVPRPPGDPALLRHVGGDIYAVLATWDLTPLEQLVLSGRRREE